ncbi:tetratricopeptide repeat protein [bacterium]|nr:tetratricopeptide repeat protein [bacterium]
MKMTQDDLATIIRSFAIILIVFLIVNMLFTGKKFSILGDKLGVFGSFAIYIFFVAILGLLIIPPITDFITQKFTGFLYFAVGVRIAKPYSLPKSYYAKGKYQEAIKEYRKMLEADPEDITAQFEIADICYFKLKNYSQAATEYREVLNKNPDDELWAFTINRLADIYCEHFGEPDWAIRELEKIVRRFPDSKRAVQARRRIESIKSKGGLK